MKDKSSPKGLVAWLYPKTWLFGRPYTHVIRDAWKEEPTSFLFLFGGVGMILGRIVPGEAFWWIIGSLVIGMILGHLFWSSNYPFKTPSSFSVRKKHEPARPCKGDNGAYHRRV